MSLRALVVDDEPLARRGVRQLLETEGDIVVIGECRTGYEALRILRAERVDVVFLDIAMPDLDGLGLVRALEPDRVPFIVFVTAHDEFAVEAFEAAAIDYLVKPVTRDRFARTMARVRERHRLGGALELTEQLTSALAAAQLLRSGASDARQQASAPLVVLTPSGERIIPLDEIDWIEADDYYARVHVGRSQYLLRESLSSLSERLDPAAFLRVHRSAIVRLERVRAITGSGGRARVVLHDDTRVPVSRRRLAVLRAALRPSREIQL